MSRLGTWPCRTLQPRRFADRFSKEEKNFFEHFVDIVLRVARNQKNTMYAGSFKGGIPISINVISQLRSIVELASCKKRIPEVVFDLQGMQASLRECNVHECKRLTLGIRKEHGSGSDEMNDMITERKLEESSIFDFEEVEEFDRFPHPDAGQRWKREA